MKGRGGTETWPASMLRPTACEAQCVMRGRVRTWPLSSSELQLLPESPLLSIAAGVQRRLASRWLPRTAKWDQSKWWRMRQTGTRMRASELERAGGVGWTVCVRWGGGGKPRKVC
jgi:hypothetical protein